MKSVYVAYYIGKTRSFYDVVDMPYLSFMFIQVPGGAIKYNWDSSTAYYNQEDDTVYELIIYKEVEYETRLLPTS